MDRPSQAGVNYSGREALREPIVNALRTVYDPEIPVDVYELGLIYKIEIDDRGAARVEMTLTSPACPSAESIPVEVKEKIERLEGVTSCQVDVVWDPPWSQEFMSEAARVQLGMY
jgi:FeS assembly SUF system protein